MLELQLDVGVLRRAPGQPQHTADSRVVSGQGIICRMTMEAELPVLWEIETCTTFLPL